MPQPALDRQRPNGSSRRKAGIRDAVHVYRLYQKQNTHFSDTTKGTSFLSPALDVVRNGIATARNELRDKLADLQGKVLVKEFRVPLIVESFDKQPDVRTSFTYLQEGWHLDTPFANAKGVTHFRVRGRTHWRPVLVNGVAVDGDAAIKEFAELIDDYFYPSNGKVTSDFELYFIDLMAPVSGEDPFGETEWLIHPVRNGVRQTMASNRPFIRQWQFEFLGLQSNRDLAKQKAEDGFLASLGRGFLGSLLAKLNLTSVVDAVREVFGTIDDVKGLVDDVGNTVTAVTDYARGVQETIRIGIGKVRGVVAGVQTLIGRIEDGIDLVRDLPSLTAQDFNRLVKDFPGLRNGDTPGIVAADELRRIEGFLLALSAQPRLFAPQLGDASSTRTISVGILPGATLDSIAAAHDVSVGDLIELNQLSFPFVDSRPNPEAAVASAISALNRITALRAERAENHEEEMALAQARGAGADEIATLKTSYEREDLELALREQSATTALANASEANTADPLQRRVLYVGDSIRVPQPSLLTPASIVEIHPTLADRIASLTGEEIDNEDRLFGVDFELDDNGNLGWDDERSEVRIERGLLHMARVQARYVRLPLGGLFYAPGIGNYAFANLGNWQGPAENQLLAFAMFKTLQQDPRVARVRNANATTERGRAELVYDADLINGQTVPALRVPVP